LLPLFFLPQQYLAQYSPLLITGISLKLLLPVNQMRSFVKPTHVPGMGGWGNGYVVIPEGHKYHGVDYNDIPVDVHYGLTFSQLVDQRLIDL
jgi:hypothetical protein